MKQELLFQNSRILLKKITQTCTFMVPFVLFLPSTHAWFPVTNKLENIQPCP
jgi:hypothetical protein